MFFWRLKKRFKSSLIIYQRVFQEKKQPSRSFRTLEWIWRHNGLPAFENLSLLKTNAWGMVFDKMLMSFLNLTHVTFESYHSICRTYEGHASSFYSSNIYMCGKITKKQVEKPFQQIVHLSNVLRNRKWNRSGFLFLLRYFFF